MKKLLLSSPLALFSALLLLALAPRASAVTTPAFSLADNLGNTVVIDGNGVVTYGGTCTPATCTTTSVSVSPGSASWAGTIGSFSLTTIVGTTKPFSVPNPSLDLNLQHVTTSTGGTLTIQWTDTGFNYSDIVGATIAAGGVLKGSGTSTYTAYFDNTNAPFGTGVQVGTIGPFSSSAFNGQVSGPGPTASPFSMTEVATLSLGPGAILGVDYEFIPLPAPLSLMCAANAAEVGVPYNSSLMAIGGITPYTFSIITGMLPPGLTLNTSTGAITGTPTAAGTYSFTAQVVDSSEGSASTATSTCTIVVTSPPPISLACPITTGQVGVPYSSALAASGGIPPYTYSIQSGMLPAGLTLNPSTGAITGTPTTAGPFTFTAQVVDSTNSMAGTATSNCGITIAPLPTANCVSITAVQGSPITPVTMMATGGTGTGYTFSATGLPSGLTMSSGGTISGTPTVSGTFPYTVTITDSGGNKGTVNCSVTVSPSPSANCAVISAIQGVAITPVTLVGAGGVGGPYTFSASGLPTGLTISSGGTISGTPTVSGTFPYTVTVTDSSGNQGTSNCSVTVLPPVTASCVVINAIQGVAITPVTMTATGGTGTGYTFSATGLPTGLTMSTGGTISGTPTVSGTFPYTVTITDSAGNKGTANCSVTVFPPITATCVVINAIQGVAITPVTMTASGGTGTGYTFSATGLPTGITMASNGTISGTPTVSGTFPYTVTVTDSAGNTGTVNCSVTVYPPITATCVVINAIQGVAITPVTMTASGGTGTGYTFSATGLPAGLTMSAGGTISGTPTVSGTFPYTVTIKDSAGNTGTVNCSVTVFPPITATCVVINAIQGVAITPVTMTASGGTGTGYTFSATGLPAGLTMSAGGTISGTPTVSGTFPYTVTIKDSAGNTGTVNCSVTVFPPITATCVVINAIQGVAITPVTMTASGGTGTGYTFSATGLPAGLTMSAGGTISGTPTVSGTFPYTVTIKDSAGNTGTVNCSVTVFPPITATCVVINAIQGVAITPVTMTASGGTGTGYTFSATGLPAGLTMSAGGTISGTPTVSGTFPYTVTIKDSAGNTGTVNCSVTVAPPITASCVSITAIQGVAITPVTMTASGGTGTGYTFSATGLPAGLTISAGGTISGTPTVSGTFPYTVTIKDSAGNTGTVNCSVTVAPPITASCVSITAIQGVAITPVTMTASGGTGTGYTFSATGLPAGLTISAGGTISGTPTVSGTFPYTVTIKDSAGNTGTVNCSVTVAPPISANCVSIIANQGVAITPVTLIATGGAGGPYTFLASGLPSGLTMSTSGTISGTPTVSGTFPYTVTITDRAGHTGMLSCSVTVGPPTCSANLGPVTYNVSEQASNVAGEIVWFNSHLVKLGGTIPTSDFTVYIQNGHITFGTATLTVPNAVINFTASASCASTTFDTVSSTWITTMPLSAAGSADEIFAAGLAYQLPAGFAQNVNNVTWSATVYSSALSLQVSWQYGVSNWLTQKNGTSFPVLADGTPDYNGMMINPAHNAPICNPSYASGDHAGAPEFTGRQNVLTGGGSGGGGSNWTGSWSSTPPMTGFACTTGAISGGDAATIGFWHNQNGQALINSLNGGSTSTALANWLATQFPYLYGVHSSNNLTGKTNANVAALFLTFFGEHGQKTDAQILAGALATYVTSTALSGSAGSSYGFNKSLGGTGSKTYNVGSSGTSVGLSNNTSYTVLQLLQQVNLTIQNGTYSADANGFNVIFSGINQIGDIN